DRNAKEETPVSPQPFRSIDSARLRLRRFRDTDLPIFLAYRNDPEVARYQDWESTSKDEGRAFLAGQRDAQPGMPGQWFQFAIEPKATGLLSGDCGLKVRGDDPRQAEIGFTLARASQGQGYASEAVAAVLAYAFEVLGLYRIPATVDCQNAAAVRLLERLGLRREGHFLQNIWFKGRWGDEYLYAVLRDEWAQRRTAPAAPGPAHAVSGCPAE